MVAPLALALERWLGYSPRLVSRIGHPVIWMGWLIAWLEGQLNRPDWSFTQRRRSGVFALIVLLFLTHLAAQVLQGWVRSIPGGIMLEALLATSLLAQKELGRSVRAVATALRTSLAGGREAVSHIVGRDPHQLDQAGVARAAVETLAESTSDGVVAPWFWLVLGGLPGLALYKAINTADSMIGHLDERYRAYGWAAARLDDWVNLVPARLTAILIVVASYLVPGANPAAAWAVVRRDAGKHRSPNSGWPESAFAGVLGFALGGPREYGGAVVDLPRMGDGVTDLGAADIEQALRLYRMTLNVLLGLSVVVAVVLWRWG